MLPNPTSPVYQHVDAALARCESLRVPALVLTAQGRVVDARSADPVAHATLADTALQSAVSGAYRAGGGVTQVAPGLHVGFVTLRDDLGASMVVAPVLVYTSALPGADVARSDAPETHFAAIRAGLDDIGALQRHAGDIENFTGQLAHAYDTIDLLYTLGRSMGRPNTPREFLAPLCARTRSVMGFAWVAAVFAGDSDIPAGLRNVTAVDGDLFADLTACRRTLLGWCGGPDAGLAIHENVQGLGGATGQVVCQALSLRGRPGGVLAAGGKGGPDPMVSSYDTQLFEACAGFLGTFLENVALYDDQVQLFMGTLQALTGAIDAKDRYTCGHSERVSLVSWQLAEAAGLSTQDAERVRIAGLVHDVGKIGVPDAVLTKPGKLTDEEYGAIKLHPEIGHRILLPVPQLKDVLPGVLHHHERWDGRGYPHRISGEEIPLMARIIAVADTFDAMSSDRSYRKRLGREQVLAEIARSGGTQLDPRLAMLMVRLDLGLYEEMTLRHAAEAGEPRKAA
jgi:HD-GYP domain-containing protein (c-di-GMP phosphodiesterase class II)